MILGVGIDVVHLGGFREQLGEPGTNFAEGTFTAGELRTAKSRPGDDMAPHLAVRYAAKEAFVKAWSSARRGLAPTFGGLDLREIEIVNDAWKRPAIRLHGRVAGAAESLGVGNAHVSLSHDEPFAAATVILERVEQ